MKHVERAVFLSLGRRIQGPNVTKGLEFADFGKRAWDRTLEYAEPEFLNF
jgi:hypothetical protein